MKLQSVRGAPLLFSGLLLLGAGGSPDAAARERGTALAECIYTHRSWTMLRLRLPVVAYERNKLKLLTSSSEFAFQRCTAKWVRPFVLEGEYPVLVGANVASMTVEGDICTAVPRFIIYDAPDLRSIFGMHGSALQPMSRRIAAGIAITTKQCGKAPDALQLVARKVTDLDHGIRHAAASGKRKSVPPPQYKDFWSGKVFPQKSMRVVSDDPEQEALYWEREDYRLSAHEQQQSNRQMRQAVGAALGMLLIGAVVNSCDPVESADCK